MSKISIEELENILFNKTHTDSELGNSIVTKEGVYTALPSKEALDSISELLFERWDK